MTLQSTPETTIIYSENYYADGLLGFVIDGWLAEQSAREITRLPHEDRLALSVDIREASESDTSSGEQQRAEWLANILARETLSETAKTVFVETVSLRPQREHKQGLSERHGSGGRHSSPNTYGW